MPDHAVLKSNSCAVADAIALLFGSRVEVVVHDVQTATIIHIANPISKREPGDPSNLDDIGFQHKETVIGPYEKVNWDGSVIRSISIVQFDESSTARFLICVNYDQTDLQAVQNAVAALLPSRLAKSQPEALFRNDWHERMNLFVTDWCDGHNTKVTNLSREDRRALLAALEASGALTERNAAAYVGRLLGVSRATIYNDLNAKA